LTVSRHIKKAQLAVSWHIKKAQLGVSWHIKKAQSAVSLHIKQAQLCSLLPWGNLDQRHAVCVLYLHAVFASCVCTLSLHVVFACCVCAVSLHAVVAWFCLHAVECLLGHSTRQHVCFYRSFFQGVSLQKLIVLFQKRKTGRRKYRAVQHQQGTGLSLPLQDEPCKHDARRKQEAMPNAVH